MYELRKIAVSLSKGGTGKTTTAVSLSAGLATKGYSVLLIDADTQDQVSKYLDVSPTLSLAEVVSQQAKPEDAITPARDHLYILSGGRALAGVKRLISQKEFGGEMTLTEALTPIENEFDYVIVDTSPGWDALTINVLFYVEEVLSPVSLEVLTLQGVIEFTKSLTQIQQYHAKLSLKYILPTFLDRRVKKSEEVLEQLEAHYDEQLCDPIRYNVRLSEAPGFGQTIFEYAPTSKGAKDYKKLTERIISDG